MLHGGAVSGSEPVDRRSGPYQRSGNMRRSIAGDLLNRGWAVHLLRFGVKGWNHRDGEIPAPVRDARWALEQIRECYDAPPLILVGHSMGARTAFHVADDPQVRGVVALAPWCEREDPVSGLRDKDLIALHGQRDRVTNPLYTQKYLARAAAVGARTQYLDMGPVGHYMIRRIRQWNQRTSQAIVEIASTVPG